MLWLQPRSLIDYNVAMTFILNNNNNYQSRLYAAPRAMPTVICLGIGRAEIMIEFPGIHILNSGEKFYS